MSKRPKNEQYNGNTIAAQAAFDRELVRVGQVLYRAGDTLERLFEHDVDVTRLSIKMPAIDKPDYMAVVTAVVAGQYVVGFHGAPTFHEALLGVWARLENGSIQWKVDSFKNG